jgi:hypothetical protein
MPERRLVDEIADGIYRISDQFLVVADEPLLFQTGPRSQCHHSWEAVSRVLPLERLRWLVFGELGADERGRVDPITSHLPHVRTIVGAVGCLDLGGRRLRRVAVPFAAHVSETQVLYEEVTRTLLGGDLDAQLGAGRSACAWATGGREPVDPTVPLTLHDLADLEPRTLAVLHGASLTGDGGGFLRSLAAQWADRSLHPTNHNHLKEHVS